MIHILVALYKYIKVKYVIVETLRYSLVSNNIVDSNRVRVYMWLI